MPPTTAAEEDTAIWPWFVAGGTAIVLAVGGFFGFRALAKKDVTPEPAPTPAPTPSPGPTPGPGPGPGPKPSGKAKGKPPNVSGDKAGYNTEIWAAPFPVRNAFVVVGYPVSLMPDVMNEGLNGPDLENPIPDDDVKQFQRDWNKVANAVAGGLVVKSKTEIPLISNYTGKLGVDGVAGENTLNALEIAWRNQFDSNIGWPGLVKDA